MQTVLFGKRNALIKLYVLAGRELGIERLLKSDPEIVFDVKGETGPFTTGRSVVMFDRQPDEWESQDLNHLKTKENICLINMDEKMILPNVQGEAVSYGVNNRSTLTASSLDVYQREGDMISLQREVASVFGNVLEPMDIKSLGYIYETRSVSSLLGLAALQIVLEVPGHLEIAAYYRQK